ncbi:MAG TPA: hypothetical protein VKU88_00445 [Acidimicrobiales bacterium]|nr:hypothetical protein [Acidimicrobiales bacterium]
MRWGKGRRERAHARAVVSEAERVLSGRTLEGFVARRQRVPAWSLISLLGHASLADLVRLGAPGTGADPFGWSGTVARLARDLLRMAGDEATLLRLQRRSLIPLELRLLGGELSPPASPADLFNLVNGYLDRPLSPEV